MGAALGIIGVPSSAGAYAPGQELAPAALRRAGLVERLQTAGVAVVDHGDSPTWRWRPDPRRPFAQNLDVVAEQAAASADRVRQAIAAGQVALVLGGDCTIELGTVAGYCAFPERVGLVYFDLHADLNVPDSVRDGALDWMGVAHLLGVEGAREELSRLGPVAPLLQPDQVLLFANGSDQCTAWERELIDRHNLATIPVTDVAADPGGAARRALAQLEPTCDRLLVHFDVDVVDFTDAPLSENTGRNIGLPLDTTMRALAALLESDRFAALTLTELNPLHGAEDGSALDRLVERLVAALVSSPKLR
jgi:arginase